MVVSETGHWKGETDERRLKGEERDMKSREKRGGIVERAGIGLKKTEVHKQHIFSLAVTYGPHVDEASAEEWVQVPVYARQTGDVEHFVPQACREQEEEV